MQPTTRRAPRPDQPTTPTWHSTRARRPPTTLSLTTTPKRLTLLGLTLLDLIRLGRPKLPTETTARQALTTKRTLPPTTSLTCNPTSRTNLPSAQTTLP